MRVDESDRSHDGDGVVGFREDPSEEVEDKGHVKQIKGRRIGPFLPGYRGHRRSRMREGIYETFEEVEQQEDAALIPHRRPFHRRPDPDLEHRAEQVPSRRRVGGGLAHGLGTSVSPADDVEHRRRHAALSELEYFRLLSEAQVRRVVRVKVAVRVSDRRHRAQIPVDQRIALVEQRCSDKEEAGCGNDVDGAKARLAGGGGAEFEGNQDGGELPEVRAVEREGQIRVRSGPANEPSRR